jgi:hypothetical protein
MHSRAVPTAILLALQAAACRDSGEAQPFTRPTLVSVDPTELQGVACAAAPGALRTYVATLSDTTPFREEPVVSSELCVERCTAYDAQGTALGWVSGAGGASPGTPDTAGGAGGSAGAASDEAVAAAGALASAAYVSCAVTCDPIPLPSSPPVTCALPVGFAFVTPGHRYTAHVEGYDRADLVPVAEGHPELSDPMTGSLVAPSWIWDCDEPAMAVRYWTTYPRGCRLRTPAGGTAATTVRVPVAAFLGDGVCGDGPDAASRFEVTLTGSDAVRELSCDETAVFAADDIELEDGRTYRLDVAAFASSDDRSIAATTCYAKVHAGVETTASCDPLTPVDE